MLNGFDIVSKKYDSIFTFSKIGMAQRNKVYQCIDPVVKGNNNLNILELNCGTGEDAIYFAQMGHEVLATDVSKGMIEVAKSKSSLANLNFERVDINKIAYISFKNKFDVIFSNFGGLNCLTKAQLNEFLKNSSSLLNQNGILSMVLMPKNCLWEKLYFLLKGQFSMVNRRNTSNPIKAQIEGAEIKTWYYNPEEILELIPDEFHLDLLKPIGITIPPSYLEKSIISKPPIFNGLNFFEKRIKSSYWAKYSDHYLIQFRRK